MFINFNAAKKDPNTALSAQQFAAAGFNFSAMNWTHLKPTKVIKNTKRSYVAKYRDAHGAYIFEIQKDAKGTYTVISDGQKLFSAAPKKRVVWEFENQINSNDILCVK